MAENQLNPIYFANEFGDPDFVLHLNISFSLSNKHADLKKTGFAFPTKHLRAGEFNYWKSSLRWLPTVS